MENVDASVGGSRRAYRAKKLDFNIYGVIGAIFVSIIVIVGAIYAFTQFSTSSVIDGAKYQAVFLSNGQVYFGKLKMLNGGYMKLNDIYYLQTTASTTKTSIQDSSDSSTNVTLIKLGSEIHGPNDEMIISKDQVLFFENVKSDSKVAESIAKYKKDNNK